MAGMRRQKNFDWNDFNLVLVGSDKDNAVKTNNCSYTRHAESSTMAGMRKQKEYDWKDSNLALFGSDEDKAVKKESAETEAAWAPVRSIEDDRLLIWRIKQFKLESVKPEDHGKFHSGDSYIILKVTKENNSLNYDVHFWIGSESTQDEYGTAAYKTVELDAFLDDRAIQHREVEGFESIAFKAYFDAITKLSGGYESGFRHVTQKKHKPRLLLFHGNVKRIVELVEVPYSLQSLNSGDVFILDLGEKAYQWNGKDSSKDERFRAVQFLNNLKSERKGRCTTIVIDELDSDETEEFRSYLPDTPVSQRVDQAAGKRAIYRMSDATGEMVVSMVCEERLPRSKLTKDDVYFIDTGLELFVYVGEKCSRKEKLNALGHAHEYLKGTNHALAPITVVSGGRKSEQLDKVLE